MMDMYKLFIFLFIINIPFSNSTLASGAFDHGTSTGKGKLQLDLTLNPFNYFKYGQNYIVANYGITDKFDLHSYYANHPNFLDGTNSYYIDNIVRRASSLNSVYTTKN